ncbi:hypothetical protein M0812_11538 [Anaeramoeba flamelloides]|uniref:Uncharacterized protein n=1 Tax=Anaeramoeba flamelloides TaxID=1746091 RepID=A0AAV7ZUI0_9EUKA|nr:hypothetical protein M0812_11538 [Anaeramoeba flamelloides]
MIKEIFFYFNPQDIIERRTRSGDPYFIVKFEEQTMRNRALSMDNVKIEENIIMVKKALQKSLDISNDKYRESDLREKTLHEIEKKILDLKKERNKIVFEKKQEIIKIKKEIKMVKSVKKREIEPLKNKRYKILIKAKILRELKRKNTYQKEKTRKKKILTKKKEINENEMNLDKDPDSNSPLVKSKIGTTLCDGGSKSRGDSTHIEDTKVNNEIVPVKSQTSNDQENQSELKKQTQ